VKSGIAPALAVSAIALAVSASPAAGAAGKRYDSTTSLAKLNPFHGDVESRNPVCETGRRVEVTKRRAGRDRVLDETRTSHGGRWSVPSTRHGDIYAQAKRRRVAGRGRTFVCAGDRSRVRHFARPPNILIFLTDDQRDSGSMIEMPTVRRVFGQGGKEFVNGFVTTPECCPSRSSIFSGQYAHNTGIITNDGTGFNAAHTWERYLQDRGYFTGLIGKYLNHVETDQAPYFDYTDVGHNGREREQVTMARAVKGFFRRASTHDSRPWALEVSTYSPHRPWTSMPDDPRPVPPFVPPYKPASFQEADRTDKDPSVQRRRYSDQLFRDQYRGQQLETQTADEEFAQLWRTVGNHHERGNLLAFFLSDNGFAWGDHGLQGKGEPYLEDAEVPFFARWPGHFAGGVKDTRIAANIDIAPTIYEATATRAHYVVDGHSLLSDYRRPWLLLEFQDPDVPQIPPWYSYLVPAKRQYIEWSDGFVEDYNLRRDPAELEARNTADAGLAAKLKAARRCSGSGCP
jgi:arylsulfatase A-like enzyme